MGKFVFTPCKNSKGKVISDLYIISGTLFGDTRGYFTETFNDEFHPYVKHLDGSEASFVQDNESMSQQGVLRGLHFQKTQPQAKLVRVISGAVFDVAVDLRRNSETYGSWFGAVLSSDNKKQLYVPEGFAHGFLVLSSTATFIYKCTRIYAPEDECGLIWNDNDIGIEWPKLDCSVLLSDKDKKNPMFSELEFAF
jgi:dTDP-4-dehydrorhamnose 3,5-epimerase